MSRCYINIAFRLSGCVFGCIMLVVTPAAAQQKVQFTQYMFNTLVINPAYAGADEALSLTFIQRNQWSGIPGAPTTQTLSGHTLFKKKQFGLGLTLVNDKIGVHKNLSALSNYAYHIQVASKSYLSFGLQAGVHNLRSDYASLLNGATADPKLADQVISQTFFDFGAGIYFRSPRLHVGLSAPEILPQQVNLNDTVSINLNKTNFFLFSKYHFKLSETFDGEPSFLVKYKPGLPVSFDLNMNFIYRKVLGMGLSYRKSESVDFILRAQVAPQLQVGYAYDYVIGDVTKVSRGSHELMVRYLFRFVQTKIPSPR